MRVAVEPSAADIIQTRQDIQKLITRPKSIENAIMDELKWEILNLFSFCIMNESSEWIQVLNAKPKFIFKRYLISFHNSFNNKNGKYNRMQYEERKKKKSKEEIEKRKGWCLHLPIFAASSSIPFHLNHHHLLLIVEIFSKDYFLFTRIVSHRDILFNVRCLHALLLFLLCVHSTHT